MTAMRPLFALALLAAGCSSAPPAPRERVDEIADAIRAGRAWESDAARDDALKHLFEKAQRRHADALFLVVEREGAAHSFAAISALAPLLAADDLPRLDAMLASKDPNRALVLLRVARFAAASPLLAKHAKRLLSGREIAKVALGTIGTLRARAATDAILEYLDADFADEDDAFKALGRLWEQKTDAPALAREDEHARLKVLLLVHGVAMKAPSLASCGALVRVMTAAELDEFLAKHATDRFPARGAVTDACFERGFDPRKGARVHQALLASPDADLVALILWTSPYKLDVWNRLDDDRAAKQARVCDYAAARLEADAAQKAIELPADAAAREKLVAKWRDKRPH